MESQHQTLLNAAKQLLEGLGVALVEIIFFRDTPEQPMTFSSIETALQHLDKVVYDGATNFGALEMNSVRKKKEIC